MAVTRLILHAGMHKTGSTSIQAALAAAGRRDFVYLDWQAANHSTLFTLLFEERPESYFAFRRRGLDREALAALRQRWLARTERQVARAGSRPVVLSAERIATAPPDAIERLRDWFAPRCDGIDVFAYVRPAVPWVRSMFEQAVRTRATEFALRWPHYRRSLAPLDRVFGRDRVHLRAFRKAALSGGDAVQDFAAWAGLAGVPQDGAARNTGAAAEAVALCLYYWRHVAGADETPDAFRASQRIVRRLRGLGDTPFHIAPALMAALAETHRADLDWIAARLGEPLFDPADLHPADPRSIALADTAGIEALAERSAGLVGAAAGGEALARALRALAVDG
jgi:hypothetical protein